jgi:CRISPR-associated exonuclease Cas4
VLTDTVYEGKMLAAMEEAHVRQVKHYLWLLEQSGVDGVSGVLEYPKLRETMKVELQEADRQRMPELIAEIEALVAQETAPPTIAKRFCEKYSYFEFCWAGEE